MRGWELDPFSFRIPGMEHAEQLYELEKLCFPSPWNIDEIKALVSGGLSVRTVAAFHDETPVGYVSATFSEPGVLHVISICVHPEMRNLGVGSGLLSCALQWGRHMEAGRVLLEVREGNLPALSFYRRHGFAENGFLRDFYGEGLNGITMDRSVDPIPGTLDAALFLNSRLSRIPRAGVVLGSGLGWVAERFGHGRTIPFGDIPGMAGTAVQGHAHKLQVSQDGSVVFLMGRRHHYQGFSGREIALLPSALASLGVSRWLLTSSSGAVDPTFRVGDAMVFTDHINFSGCIPDVPPFYTGGGMYSERLRTVAEGTLNSPRKGVFACVSGPAYETAAEVDLIRSFGCSAVSMSTAQEAMALRALGCQVLALALITNAVEAGDSVCHQEVLSAQETISERQGPALVKLVERLRS